MKVSMFDQKVVWITGASSGIGEALAYELSNAGAHLILSARNTAELERVQKSCATQTLVLPLDVTDYAMMEAAVKQAQSWKGRIDMLLNNAGISQRSRCVDTDMQTFRTLFEVDVFAQIALTKQVLPIMLEQGSGHIAVTASVAGKIGAPMRTAYCAAKHAMMGFFDSLRTEVSHQNIRVTTITPGYIRTNISTNALNGDGSAYAKLDAEIKSGMSAEECASVIVRGMRKNKPEIAVGRGLEMHALWLKRLSPRLVFKLAAKQFHKTLQDSNLK